ncbi:uncharacterized protein FA14DRAFT_176226 [Meira miltonrushii]|uniref:Transmembrane protein n=1 Tax=Meira miltonrushii TaxID=1280837 RepID=A0A316VKP8_9BASI|nr:uncharacterized protein FA14DRAFT_176226 [Meira miltonrushii]PWN36923.1 hypothetical protein FA14DRAFT_176226 [Meira miltonrushii]
MLLPTKTSQSDRNGNVQLNVPLYSEEADREVNPPPTYNEVVTRDILLTPTFKRRLIGLCLVTIFVHCFYIFILTQDGGTTKTTSNPVWIALYIIAGLISSFSIRRQAFVWIFKDSLSPQSSLTSSTAGREVLLVLWIVNTIALLAGLLILSDFANVDFSSRSATWIIVALVMCCVMILSFIIAVFRAAHAQQGQIRR